MFRNRFMLYRHRHLMFIDSGEQSGGSGEPSAEPEKPTGKTDGEDRSKDFSRALAKRVAEIEAKYSDYEELKAKAAKYDERESESKSDMDKLNERLAAIEKERDELKASEEHRTLVDKVAKETGLPAEVVAMLSGDDESALKEHAGKLGELMSSKQPKPRHGSPRTAQAGGRRAGDNPTAMDLLRDAYSD